MLQLWREVCEKMVYHQYNYIWTIIINAKGKDFKMRELFFHFLSQVHIHANQAVVISLKLQDAFHLSVELISLIQDGTLELLF